MTRGHWRAISARAGLLLLLATLTACSGGASPTAKEIVWGRDIKVMKAEVIRDMKVMHGRMKAEHFSQCRKRLETTSTFGLKYRTVGDFQPHGRLSCLAQRRTGNPYVTPRIGAAYIIRIEKVSGGFGSSHDRAAGGCLFALENGSVKIVAVTRAYEHRYCGYMDN